MLVKQISLFSATVILVYLAFPFGLTMVAWAMAFVGVLDFIISSIVVYFTIKLSVFAFIGAMWKNIFLVFTCFIAAYLSTMFIDIYTVTPILSLLIIGPIVLITWFASLYLTKHPLLNEIMNLTKPLLRKMVRPS